MIPRYTLPEMEAIWSDQTKYETWLKIEVAACEALHTLGKIPAEDLKAIQEKANFNIDRINEIENVTHHDVIAFLTSVSEFVGPSSRYIHMGLTSSDILDTALAVHMVKACGLILDKTQLLVKKVIERAKEHKFTPMIGRSHGVHAEPITLGLKLALMKDELCRNITRLEAARDDIAVGKLSGAVGTHAHLDPYVEDYVCKQLGLKAAALSTQIIQRDRHAYYLSVLACLASTLEKYAEEIRNLQHTEIRELEEPFAKGQKGSSAMPHKRNPIICERICGMARIVRANAMVGLENVSLWHERDISHSSAERVIIPDSTHAVYYMLHKFVAVIEGLMVYPENMMKNLNLTRGLIYSQRILLELVQHGITREDAYLIVQRNAMKVWSEGGEFMDFLLADADLLKNVTPDQIRACFDIEYHFKYVDDTFKKLNME
ncbi:MAG: adenylosuccinate lyase [Candidatus Auribacter fodinae]|jgi:adenylosuccinate lyase|uniref:Adenylosuccinate lyase n=1 Tax=Candidatus Auribacter fodinae TaxID=2093366 RepID=A0A3A4QRB1_9BACT|nr:MAG: adenylosuccinate lyase [Candidatus Auribacter fodinae]